MPPSTPATTSTPAITSTPSRATGLLTVTVRHFAAARAAAGASEEQVSLPPGATVADLVAALGHDRPELARVLLRCSFLHDQVAVRNRDDALRPGSVLDVLPPFAGG